MPHKYELTFVAKETGENITLSGEFPDNEWGPLEAFVQCAEEVISTNFIRNGHWGGLNIHWENSSMNITTELPPWDDVIVLLHKFRPLLLQNERTNFYVIHNVLAKKLNHPYFRSFLGQQREIYSGKTMQSMYQIFSNDVLINSEKVLFDWLNSHEYHREKGKQEFIASLHQMIPLDASRVIFLRLLTYKAVAVHNLAAFIQVILGKQKSLNIKMMRP